MNGRVGRRRRWRPRRLSRRQPRRPARPYGTVTTRKNCWTLVRVGVRQLRGLPVPGIGRIPSTFCGAVRPPRYLTGAASKLSFSVTNA